jgi:hypothetical protein
METFTFYDKTYTLKNKMSFGEVTKTRKLNKDLIETAKMAKSEEAIANMPVQEQLRLIESSDHISEEYAQLMTNVLYRCLDLSQEDLNNMEFLKSVELFGRVYQMSTEIKKKSETQSQSPSPQTT